MPKMINQIESDIDENYEKQTIAQCDELIFPLTSESDTNFIKRDLTHPF